MFSSNKRTQQLSNVEYHIHIEVDEMKNNQKQFLLQSLLTSGKNTVTVCRGNKDPPTQSNILVVYDECLISCSDYLGVTALCFIPAQTGPCPAQLPANPTPCTDQTTLKARLVSNSECIIINYIDVYKHLFALWFKVQCSQSCEMLAIMRF